jgi:dipeptidyl aminopeptidase/acylaminoacyl peptidase
VRLIRLDLGSGAEKTIIEESAVEGYVETHPLMFHPPNVRVLERSKEVIWYSDRDGWGHLYLVNLETGAVTRQITKGAWVVRDIVHVDEVARTLVFTASGFDTAKDLGRRRLCEVSLDTGEFRVLISHDGDVVVAPAPTRPEGQAHLFRPDMLRKGASADGRFIVARRTHVKNGAATVVLDRHTGTETVLCEASSAVSAPSSTPTELSFVAADGVTSIHGLLVLPREANPESKQIPLIDLMYPGPQSPWVPRGYGATQVLAAQSMAELGFAVLLLDTRGIPHRARAIRQAGYGSDLEPQLADHAAAVAQVCAAHRELDPRRVAAVGVSAGGAGAARALFDYPSTYCCAVAIAGSHEVRNYRSGWADFYLGPKSNEPSNIDLAHKLKGALMLVSGDMDDNVPISQTLRLVDALIRANKDFELLIAPNEGHLTFLSNGYVHRRVWDFLVRKLFDAEPPKNFPLSHAPEALAAYGRVLSRGAPE